MTKQTFEEFLADDPDYTLAMRECHQLKATLDEYEEKVSKAEQNMQATLEVIEILYDKLTDMETEADKYARLDAFIEKLVEDKYKLLIDAGNAARGRADIKAQYVRQSNKGAALFVAAQKLYNGEAVD